MDLIYTSDYVTGGDSNLRPAERYVQYILSFVFLVG